MARCPVARDQVSNQSEIDQLGLQRNIFHKQVVLPLEGYMVKFSEALLRALKGQQVPYQILRTRFVPGQWEFQGICPKGKAITDAEVFRQCKVKFSGAVYVRFEFEGDETNIFVPKFEGTIHKRRKISWDKKPKIRLIQKGIEHKIAQRKKGAEEAAKENGG